MNHTDDVKRVEKILKTLANRRRLGIINYLRKNNEAKVGDIADEIKISFKATSKHLGLLYNSDIVEKEQRGLQMWYRISSKYQRIIKHISNSLE